MDKKEENRLIAEVTSGEYKEGFVTDVEQEYVPKGLSEEIIRMISARKEEPEWLLEFRLDAFRKWQAMEMPSWAHLERRMPTGRRKSIRNWPRPSRNSAFRSASGKPWPGWSPWTPFSTPYP